MRKLSLWILTAAVCGVPVLAAAHTGGPLDADGCHADHRTGGYHCHRGAAAGYTFPNKAAMQEAVRTGVFPEKSVDEEGFFSKLWPFGKHHEEAAPAPAPQGGSATDAGAEASPAPAPGDFAGVDTGPVVSPGPAPGSAAGSQQQGDTAQRLKVLQGLYEMGLITKEEYEAKRKAVLDQL